MSDPYFHPTALVETQNVGEGTNIWAYAHVMKNAVIGSHCNIGDHCFIESGVAVGNGVTIKNGNMLFEGLTLEDGVFVGPHVFFTNDLYPRSPRLEQAQIRYENKDWLSATLVQRGATLGAGAIIIAGVSIGEFAMIGAGTVVTKDVSPYALVVGNPSRFQGWVCQCGQRIFFSNGTTTCLTCRKSYKQNEDSIELII
jgi:UDP-2-acetamido-3-amino-2,3-dideoxy-glucuronate N-acetyltransferase